MKQQINIVQEGNKAKINIIGNISNWRNDSKEFYQKVKEIQDQGIVDIEIYINSFGGSVFEANEISNIIIGFEGTVSFILGAVCASAATIIIAQVITQKHGVTIAQHRNGQFMIHNVSGEISGGIKDIESGLQLMRNLQQNAVDAYVMQTGISDKIIIAMMDKETWMTATEALQKKFITSIIEKVDVMPSNFAQIKNCGYKNLPENLVENNANDNNNNNQILDTMSLEQIKKATGKDFANEAEAMDYIANLQTENARITAEKLQAQKAVRNTEIENILEKAISDKKILPSQKADYQNLLENNFDTTKKVIEEMQGVQLISQKIKPDVKQVSTTDKTYKELAEKDPETLKEMFENDFEQFNKLFKAEYNRDFVKSV